MLTFDEQIAELNSFPPAWAVKTAPGAVKGPFTTGDFVTYQLNRIFGHNGWSFEVSRFDTVTLNEVNAYVRVVGRLTVRFADGSTVTKEDVGITPVTATKAAGTLVDTRPEVFETGEKAAVTDCLKACAEKLGLCFRPLLDQELAKTIQRDRAPRPNGNGQKTGQAALSMPDDQAGQGASPATSQPAIETPVEFDDLRSARQDLDEQYRPAEVPKNADELLAHVNAACTRAGVAGYKNVVHLVRAFAELNGGQGLPVTRTWTGDLVTEWTRQLVDHHRA
jgi:hypothetical protein